MTDLNTYYKTDAVDDVMAQDINRLIASSDYATFRNVETLSADKNLSDTDCPVQYLTPSGANRNVILPTAATTNHKFVIINPTGTSYSLVVKTYGSVSTLATLTAGQGTTFYSSGGQYINPTAAFTVSPGTSGNVLTSDGSAWTSAAPVVTLTNTATLTNKRITPRVTSITSSATPTINTDSCDFVTITALAAPITSMTTNLSGTPTDGQKLIIRFKDNGAARAITWGASFASRGVTLPSTTVISKVLTVGFLWNSVTSTWDCVASAQEA